MSGKKFCRFSPRTLNKPECNSIHLSSFRWTSKSPQLASFIQSAVVTDRAWGILKQQFGVFFYVSFQTLLRASSPTMLCLLNSLQTIYGEMISLESNSDAVGLAMFILQRLLWNPDIAAEYRHAKVPHLYKDGNFRAPVIVLSELLLSGPKK